MRRLLLLSLVAGLAGCARFPDAGVDLTTRLVFTLTVDGRIRTGQEPGAFGVPYVYMVALNPSTEANPTVQGPIPVVAPPWGNGFVAGNARFFVWWDPTQTNEYTLYKFRDADLNEYFPVGVPVAFESVESGATRIRFELDLTQIADTPADAENLRSLQVNFLTMDRIPLSGTQKLWEGLGDGRLPASVNDFVTIPLDVSGTYDNDRAGEPEPRLDVPDPDLDMVDWRVEVRIQ